MNRVRSCRYLRAMDVLIERHQPRVTGEARQARIDAHQLCHPHRFASLARVARDVRYEVTMIAPKGTR